MNLNYKKIGLIIGFMLLSAFIAYLIYSVFFQTSAPATTTTEPTPSDSGGLPSPDTGTGAGIVQPTPGGLPSTGDTGTGAVIPPTSADSGASSVARGGVTRTVTLNQNPSRGLALSTNQSDLVYYDDTNKKFYRVNGNGIITQISDKEFFNVDNVVWSPKQEKAVIEYPDGANIVYDFSTNKQVTLPRHWEDFDFAPSGNEIVSKSIGLDEDNRWLVITNDDGTQARNIEPIGKNAAKVRSSWSPNNQSVALFTESVDLDRQKLYFIGKNQENFKAATIEGRGLQHQWTPDGSNLIYSVYSSNDDLRPQLWITNAQGESIGQNRRRLPLQTWADKCSIVSVDTMYCAVPRSLPEGAGLFPELAKGTSDDIYKVNLKTGATNLVAIPDQNFSINNIVVPPGEDIIYFTDSLLNNIHSINLR
ncbi:MAG: hypothetical protein Q8Q23_05675 [bacterium]|nr:hypothetical protein [bacterium]